MTHPGYRSFFLAAGTLLFAAPAFAQAEREISFNNDVMPVFRKRCQTCHGVDDKGGLRLDTFENVASIGGSSGAVVVPKDPNASNLIARIEGIKKPQMPLGGPPLTRAEKMLIFRWIQQGARDDGAGAPKVSGAEKPLEITTPKQGSTVREKVKIVIPRASIPPEGFVAIRIDGEFRVALAPPSVEELEEKKLPLDSPLTYIWDTQAPIAAGDSTRTAEEQYANEGAHVIEVISYNSLGSMAEKVATQITLKNKPDVPANKPVWLRYSGAPGRQYTMEHVVDLTAEAGERAPADISQSAAQGGAGGNKITHQETTRYLVSLEDIVAANGTGFWRERRESPLTIVVNNLKQIVRFDSSSRYFAMDRTGRARLTKVMEREGRTPVINPITLPGRPQRMNEPFTTDLRVHLGAYIPAFLEIERVQAQMEGVEWQQGEQCVKIVLTYLSGKAKVDINSSNIRGADLSITQGTSTVWFSEGTGRVIKAKHDITGNLVVDTAQAGGGMGGGMGGFPGMGGPGGEMGPGMDGGPPGGMGMGGYGAMMGGRGGPGGAMGGGGYPGMAGGAGFGAPFGGAGAGGPGAGFGSPFGGAGGAGRGGYPGMGGGMGAMGPGMPGMGGMGPGMGAMGPGMGAMGPGMGAMGPGMGGFGGEGGGTGITGSTTKNYHVTLKVTSTVLKDQPAAKAVAFR